MGQPLPDVLVVGAGAVGASCARALSAAGATVTVLQRPDTPGEAWRNSAGVIGAQIGNGTGDPLYPLGIAGRGFYQRNAAALHEATGIDIGLVPCGVLETIHDPSQVEPAKERVAGQRQQGGRADWLEADEVALGWAWLAPCLGALWSPDDGMIDPERLVRALRTDAARLGARTAIDTARGLVIDRGRLRGVRGEDREYRAPVVVIAAGAWSGRIDHMPRPLSVEPVRGQMVSFPWPDRAAPAIVFGGHCCLLPRDGEMLVGATMEHAGFEVATTAAAGTDLHRHAGRLYHGLAAMEPLRAWAGLRPVTPDGLPIIGPEPRLPGLWYATGHGRNGILLAGITGELLARRLAGGAAPELAPFRPERFWDW